MFKVIEKGKISLHVNGEIRQNADLSDMIWSVPEMISILSEYFELSAGDIILTGTPAGVGAVRPGDNMRAYIERLGEFVVMVH